MFWLFCAAMAVIVSLAIFWPALRRRPADERAEDPAQWDLRVYRDQLAGIERDLARGVLPEAEAARLRAEIGRKVIEANRALAARTGSPTAARGLTPFWALGVMGALLIGAFVFYDRIGAPDLPDLPRAERLASAQRAYDARPAQSQAEAKAGPGPRVEADAKYVELVDQLRAAVQKRPDDVQGLTLLADHEANLGHFKAAYAAQQQLIAARGAQASGDDYARLAALMTEAAGGQVTPEAEAALRQALALDPQNGPARYMAGLLEAQIGRPDRTFPIWRDLLERGPAGAPWVMAIRPVITELAWLAGEPGYQPPAGPAATGAMPALDDDQLAAAQDMSDDDRNAMARDMVRRLEARLATQGGTPVEWARLIASLGVIGETAHAADILAEARSRFADQPEALAMLDEAAAKAGLAGDAATAPAANGDDDDANGNAAPTPPAPSPSGTPAPAAALPGPDADAMQAAAQMSDSDRQAMIETMVEGLETRLRDKGGSVAEWARLVGSLHVLGQDDRARAALRDARAAFDGDASALAALSAAATDAGLE
ncbi:c-type cytochrome biogenesis protein CcmI [Paracoccus jiaweipingae]|uniref:c-type cytochrome biogenesis protein CcmI n=1 Tax=unclassified Paracoccus (in: a-proteobacteria) TaxID=2688777 RepID=UPI0037A08E68